MNGKRRVSKTFSFIWDGVVHLEDGSQWRLEDATKRHDVIWWQTGETVEIGHSRGVLVLRNVARHEAVSIVAAEEEVLKLAA